MNMKKLILGIGIFVVYALALHQGMETFYPTPQWDAYCTVRSGPIGVGSTSCSNVLGLQQKADACWKAKGEFAYEYDANGCAVDGTCDDCSIRLNKDLDVHSTKVFVIAMIIGIIVFVVGLFLLATEPVGSALMASGIFTIFYGVVINWRNLSNSWRFLLLFVLLVILIWVALRFNDKRKKFGFRLKWK